MGRKQPTPVDRTQVKPPPPPAPPTGRDAWLIKCCHPGCRTMPSHSFCDEHMVDIQRAVTRGAPPPKPTAPPNIRLPQSPYGRRWLTILVLLVAAWLIAAGWFLNVVFNGP